jgi:pimeloyl-ACP methyl ester carboxylesterase
MITAQGYYFATSSFRSNGLVVQDAIADLKNVAETAKAQIRQEHPLLLLGIKVILAGVSEGGLITTLSLERDPSYYAGGLAMCGPIGDFQQQINYLGDFRTVFDVYDANIYNSLLSTYNSDVVTIPTQLIYDWYQDTGGVKSSLLDTITNSANLSATLNLLDAVGAPYESNNIIPSVKSTVSGLLDYNIFATMEGQEVLGGNPYSNQIMYYLSNEFPDINDLVKRYTADLTALTNLAQYETSGNLSAPLVVFYTIYDPIVSYRQGFLYSRKISPDNTKFKLIAINRYGHCNFSTQEILNAFTTLDSYVISDVNVQAQIVLTPNQYNQFYRMLRKSGKMP